MQKTVEKSLSAWQGCPVCLGCPLDQWLLQQDDRAVKTHHCPQCSGMWLEPDAVLALRSTPLEMWKSQIPFHYDAFLSCCRHCGHQISRRARACSHCHVPQVIQCVICQRALETHFVGGTLQEYCPVGHGLWLDHIAWTQLWELPDLLFPEFSQAIWQIEGCQQPARQIQTTWQKRLDKTAVQRLRQQGFESQIGPDGLSSLAVSKGSLRVVAWLAKGAFQVSWSLGRTLGRLFLRLGD